MIIKRNTKHIRIYPEDKDKLQSLKREICLVENRDIKVPEIMRRTFNIPNLKMVLIEDAKKKRGSK